jgi:hypothetical protein
MIYKLLSLKILLKLYLTDKNSGIKLSVFIDLDESGYLTTQACSVNISFIAQDVFDL